MDANERNILKKWLTNFIGKEMEIEIKIKIVGKIGKKACPLEMENMGEKIEIFKISGKLKRMREDIYLNSDMTVEEKETQSQIRKRGKEEGGKENRMKTDYMKL